MLYDGNSASVICLANTLFRMALQDALQQKKSQQRKMKNCNARNKRLNTEKGRKAQHGGAEHFRITVFAKHRKQSSQLGTGQRVLRWIF